MLVTQSVVVAILAAAVGRPWAASVSCPLTLAVPDGASCSASVASRDEGEGESPEEAVWLELRHGDIPDELVGARAAVRRRRTVSRPAAAPLPEGARPPPPSTRGPPPTGVPGAAAPPPPGQNVTSPAVAGRAAWSGPGTHPGGNCTDFGTLRLDGDIKLVPDYNQWLGNAGHWDTWSKSGIIEWSQLLASYSYDEVFFKIKGESFVKVRVLSRATLANFNFPSATRDHENEATAMAVIDCEERLLYVIQEDHTPANNMQILDASGNLLATVTADPLKYLLIIETREKQPLGFAESPMIGSNTRKEVAALPDPSKGNVRSWEVHFQASQLTVTGGRVLSEVDMKWILAVSVQMHAIREAQRGSGYQDLAIPWQLPFLWILTIMVIVAFLVLFHWSLWKIYWLVYPAPRWGCGSGSDNPFLLAGEPTPFWFNLNSMKETQAAPPYWPR